MHHKQKWNVMKQPDEVHPIFPLSSLYCDLPCIYLNVKQTQKLMYYQPPTVIGKSNQDGYVKTHKSLGDCPDNWIRA